MRSVGFAAAVALSLVVLFLPASGVPTAPAGTDKVVHLLLFALLAVTGRRAGLPVRGLLAGLLAYAAVSEILQATLPIGRDGDVWDALVDAAGVLAGLYGFAVLRRRARTTGAGGSDGER